MKRLSKILMTTGILILALQFSHANPVKVGFCMANTNGDRWMKDREYLPREAAKSGVEILVYDALNSHEKQFEQAKAAIDSGITVLILIPVDAEKAVEIVDFAHRRSVKVISYDRLVLNAQVDYYISFDPIKVGKIEAAYALKHRPEGNYMILKGPLKDYNAVLFPKGQMEVLEPHIKSGKIRIIYEKNLLEWGDMEAFMDLQEFLPSYEGKIDAILSTSDKTASGALMLLESYAIGSDYILTGQGASLSGCQDILEGKMTMTVYKPVNALAKLAVDKAIKISQNQELNLKDATTINNGKYDIPAFYIDPMEIDIHNIDKLIADGFWSKEQLQLK